MKKYFIGIDQGTIGTTALLVNEKWEVVAIKNVEHTQIYPKPGWVEHDPEEIWEAMQKACADVMRQAGIQANQIASIGIDNQGATCLIWDKVSGKPMYNAIVWQDKRTAEYCDELTERYGSMIKEKTGLFIDANYSASKIQWMLDNVEGAREKAAKGELMAGTLEAYLIWRMTGGKAFIADPSTEAQTMLMNIRTCKWEREILDIFKIPRSILPDIVDSSKVYGYTTPDTFFGEKVPVSGNIVDAISAMLAQACLLPGDIKTTYGTGCFMMLNIGNEPLFSDNVGTGVNWSIDGKVSYCMTGDVLIAGAAIQWLRDKLKIINKASETEALSMSVKDTGGVYFVPAFVGLGSPHWDQYARGTIIGITGGTSIEHIVRATLESIAFQVCDNTRIMTKDAGYTCSVMKVDGGPVVNNFLMQFQADLLGIPVDVPVVTEMTAYGAAFLGALAIGEFNSVEDIRDLWKLQRRYEPKMSEDEREFRIDQWHRAVERSKGWEISKKRRV